MSTGQRLKDMRARLGISTRDVAERSQRIAGTEDNAEFYVSNAWLTQVENTNATPSIYKLYSLSAIYHVKFTDLLLLFGVNLSKIGKHLLPPDTTQLTSVESGEGYQKVTLPERFSKNLNLDHTNLVRKMIKTWGEVPMLLLQTLDIRHDLYGFVGLRDYTLSPLVRPGAFVHIDPRMKKIRTAKWRTEFERPIYFVELRDGYACSWCELQENKLLLVPHPLSPCSIRQLSCGTEAAIIGQVTGVAMRIISASQQDADKNQEMPKLS